jgi:membrane fusion protein, multidrug efflux system
MSEMPRVDTMRQAIGTDAIPSSTDTAVARHRPTLRRTVMAAALLAGTALAGYYGHDYWTNGRFLVSTDDAYVKADYTTVAPKVAGYLSAVLVEDNQTVQAGQVLARIDDRDLRTSLDQAHADVAAAVATVRNLEARISLQSAEIAQTQAAIEASEARLGFAQMDAERYSALATTGAGTVQRTQQTSSARDQAAAQLRHDQAALLSAERQVPVLVTLRDQAMAQAEHSRAVERQAELNLSYATITAAVDGTVGARSLRVGQYVAPGTQLMAVVPLHATYVVANYKETQLAEVRVGQKVLLRVDGLPGRRLEGRVDSVSPASGLEFALLPPDNATGNFTKIVQRIPVRISIDASAAYGLLRAGMSVEPAIDTRSGAPASAAASSTPAG